MTIQSQFSSRRFLPIELLALFAIGCTDGPKDDPSTSETGTDEDAESGADTTGSVDPPDAAPDAPTLTLSTSAIKRFDFEWMPAAGADDHQLLERATPAAELVPIGGDITGMSASLVVPLHLRHEASYVLRACNAAGCTDSAAVDVTGSLAEAVGYFKASNTAAFDRLAQNPQSLALSRDGSTLAVASTEESSAASGIDGDQTDDSASQAGAVYVFVRNDMNEWSQQAYVKASNPGAEDGFGVSLALSADGSTLAVGAIGEDSNAPGIEGDQGDDPMYNAWYDSGAAYVFMRDETSQWSQQAYIKASNADHGDLFGASVALNSDGDTLAVGAIGESSSAAGVGGDETDESAPYAGAVYVFVRSGSDQWSQQAYIKASNATENSAGLFGLSVSLSTDGDTLAVGAYAESSNATGIDGDQADYSAPASGAAYVFARVGAEQWSQQAYIKASNTQTIDWFGEFVVLSGDGNTLAVAARLEDGSATGIDGGQNDESTEDAGAVYVFARSGTSQWSQQAYVKASNTAAEDHFGQSLALSGDGDLLVVTAPQEDGGALGVGGDDLDDSAEDAGAAYVFVRSDARQWSQRAYIKAPNTEIADYFGTSVALSGDGRTMAVGAERDDGSSVGVGGNELDESAHGSGAVFLY